ncbi:uncharacterized protein LOC110813398 [Carica papaya]|uniref:uncharacterized protein LOC110813398 n=1 Tax=Carica papaya TaxID=3649 RepID=UPI000B8CB326|nr:uncharacterized protein LOC110813398 [Carica papaya]
MAALRWFVHSACHVLGYNQQGEEKVKVVGIERLKEKRVNGGCCSEFQMPLHYPRYSKSEYEKMEEWKVDLLLREYGLSFNGSLDEKRAFAMGAFLWPDQY